MAPSPRAGPGRSPPPSPPWPGAPRSPSACASGRSCRTATSASRYPRPRDSPGRGPGERSGRAGRAALPAPGLGDARGCPAASPAGPARLWPPERGCLPPVPSLGVPAPCFGAERGCRAGPGAGLAEGGVPGLWVPQPALDWPGDLTPPGSGGAWRGTAGRGAQVPFRSSGLPSARLGQPSPAGHPQPGRGLRDPAPCPCHRRAPRREGDSVSEVLHLLRVIPGEERAGLGSAGSPQGKVGQHLPLPPGHSALPVPSVPPGGEADVVADTSLPCPDLGQGRL